ACCMRLPPSSTLFPYTTLFRSRCDLLEENRLSRPRRGDDQGALALPQRRDEVDDAHGDSGWAGDEIQLLIRIDDLTLVEVFRFRPFRRIHAHDGLQMCDLHGAFAPRLQCSLEKASVSKTKLPDEWRGNEGIIVPLGQVRTKLPDKSKFLVPYQFEDSFKSFVV